MEGKRQGKESKVSQYKSDVLSIIWGKEKILFSWIFFLLFTWVLWILSCTVYNVLYDSVSFGLSPSFNCQIGLEFKHSSYLILSNSVVIKPIQLSIFN